MANIDPSKFTSDLSFGGSAGFAEAIARSEDARRSSLGYADIIYDRLIEQIKSFEENLKPDEEIAAYLASFGTKVFIQIEEIGYQNPYFIVFYGKNIDTKDYVQLVQHTTQLNVLFTAVKVSSEDKRPARRLGFSKEESIESEDDSN